MASYPSLQNQLSLAIPHFQTQGLVRRLNVNGVFGRIGKNPNFRSLGINVVSRKVSSQNKSQIEFVQLLLIGNKALTEVFVGEIHVYSVGG